MKSIFWLDEVMNMGNSRDDFTSATKELLANRVGRRCSNPACRKLTCGANTNPEKITNIGVAAHICAAAQGGPRYDASMTPEERKSFENGIWLCQSCSKLIDTDITRYPKELLQSWKQLAEQTAILEVETTSSTPAFEKDKELVQFYLECFDRPAFQDDIYQEGRMEDFDKAIEDTLIALNTGVLRTRDGSILKQADGKSSVQNSLWREKLYTITDMLTAIRRRLKIAKKEKAYSTYGTGEDVAYCFYDRELAEWLNSTREEILKIHSKDKKIDENVDFKDIAEDTAGFTGAELANILNEAAIIATINKHDEIENSDIEEAVKKVLKAAGVSEEKLESYGISIADIVSGKVSSDDLAKYGISANVLDGLKNSGNESVENAIENADIPESLQETLIKSADIPAAFKNLLLKNNNKATYQKLGVTTFAQYVGAYIAKQVINIIAFILTFIVVTIILRAVVFALDIVTELPGVGALNHLAGGLFGMGIALVIVWIIFMVITLMYTTDIGKEIYRMVEDNTLLKLIYDGNPIMKLATGVKY